MKTNTLQLTITALVGISIALLAASTLAVAVGYVTVALVVAVAAVDYRQGPKSYSAR